RSSYPASADSIPDPKANRKLPGGDNQPVERKPDRPGALSGSVSARVRPGMRHFLQDPPDCRVHHDWLAEETVWSEPVSTQNFSGPRLLPKKGGGGEQKKQPP